MVPKLRALGNHLILCATLPASARVVLRAKAAHNRKPCPTF